MFFISGKIKEIIAEVAEKSIYVVVIEKTRKNHLGKSEKYTVALTCYYYTSESIKTGEIKIGDKIDCDFRITSKPVWGNGKVRYFSTVVCEKMVKTESRHPVMAENLDQFLEYKDDVHDM